MFEENKWEEYLNYLYKVAENLYRDCTDIDALVQDSLTSAIVKLNRGEKIESPKGYLSAVLKNKYNNWLREKYRGMVIEYSDGAGMDQQTYFEQLEEKEELEEEYHSVRREIGRLTRIYREVTVRHYVHGHSVEKISNDLGIPRGTVLSRLYSAREQIKEGLQKVEKYSSLSYEPKIASIGIWGNQGFNGEPFSLLNSHIEPNVMAICYEKPLSLREIADTLGIPAVYLEPITERLVKSELMGKTKGGQLYTRCFVQEYHKAFGNVVLQEALAKKYARPIWDIVWHNFEPLTDREEFTQMSEKQKGTLFLFFLNQMLTRIVYTARPDVDGHPQKPPERPNGGRWLATLTLSDYNQKRDSKYEASGPVLVSYSKDGGQSFDCQMFDCQSVFGNAHWAYNTLKYQCDLQSILRFYASFLPCDVKTDNDKLYEMIPEFEDLGILKRENAGEIKLDIPALPFSEVKNHWDPVFEKTKKEVKNLILDDVKKLYLKSKNKVPKHVDEGAYFTYAGVMGAYARAQMLEIVEQKLMPYTVNVGKTPLIYIAYRKDDKK